MFPLVFPPKTDAMDALLWKSVERLCSVKTGLYVGYLMVQTSGGADRTHEVGKAYSSRKPVLLRAHLTCVDGNKKKS